MSGRTRVTLFGVLATLLTSWSLAPLVDTPGWLVQAALLLAVQAAVGAGARRVPLARTLTVGAQPQNLEVTLTPLIIPGAEEAAELAREAWRNFAEFNLNPPLALEALFIRLRRAFAGVVAPTP